MDFASMKRRQLQALCRRHGLAAGGSNADLAARLAATLSGCGGAEEKVVGVVVGKGCLKLSGGGGSGGSSGAAKKVIFVLEDEVEAGVRGRSRRSRVVWSPVVAKTRGRRKAGEVLPAAEASGGRRQRKVLQVDGDSADEGVAGEAGADAPVRRSRRNAVNSGADDVVERVAGAENRNNSVNAEEQGEEVGEAVDRKRKRKTRENAEDIVVSAQVGVSRRSARSSGLLSVAAVVRSPVVEKKRGRRKAGDVKEQKCVEEQPADVQDLGRMLRSAAVAKVSPVVVESKRRKVKEEEPAVQKAAKVEISARTTRSRSVAAALVSPIVVEDKRRRRTDDVRSDGELLTVPEAPINDGPVTRGFRNRAVQVNDSMVEEAHVGKKMENKGQPSRPATRRHQQLPSSVEEEAQEQVAAPFKGPAPRRSRQNHSKANELLSNNNTTSETNNWSKAPVEANDSKITRPLTRNAAKDSVEDDLAKEDGHLGFTKRNTRSGMAKVATNVGEVSFSDRSGKASAIEIQLEVTEPVRRLRRKSVVPRGQEFQDAKGEDVEKQPAVKEPVRRSTRKSVVPAMLEKERKAFTAEMIPEAHVRRPTRKSVLPNMLNNENEYHCEMFRSEGFQSAKGEYVEKQPTVKEPVRGSTRKSVVPAMLEKERKGIPAEMNPEAHVRRSMQRSVLPNMLNNGNKNHGEMVRSEPTTSKGRLAKRRRTSTLQEVMSVEEPKADDMVIREKTQDEVTHKHSEESSSTSSSIQEISQDNATGEEFPSAPLLGTLPEETCRVLSVNGEIHGSESGDLDKRGQNQGATESTHQCEQVQEHGDFRNDNSHLSDVGFGELDQSSSIIELVPHAGILSESKVLLDEGKVDLGAKGMQTLNADSSEDRLGALNKSAGIAEEIRLTTAVLILEAEAPIDEGVNNNGMDSTVGIHDMSVALPEQLLGASDKLQIVDDVAPCTCDAVVMENDSRVCDGTNWTDIKSTEGIENGDIALSNDGLEAFKSIAVAEEAPSCTVAGVLEDDTPAKEIFEGIGMNNEASVSLVGTGSRGNKSYGQSTKSLEASLFEFNPNYLPTVNFETKKQSDEGCVAEVASQFLSHCDDTTITVTKYEFAWQKGTQGVSTDGNLYVVPIDFTVGDHEEKYPASPVGEQKNVSREANTNETAEKTLADILPAVLHTKDLQHDHDHAPGKLVDILAKETGKASGSDINSHQCIFPTEHDESGNRPQVHSNSISEKSMEDADLGRCLSNDKEKSSLSTTLHVEGATEDKSMFPILSDVEGCSSDGRHLSFGLKFLFAEEDKESYLINDEHTAVKVDCGHKSIDCKTPGFYRGSDCGLEDEDVQLIGERIAEDKSMLPTHSDVDVCSSDGRHSLFGQKALFAAEGTVSYLTNDACVAAEIDCKKKLGDEIVSVYLESDCSLEEEGVVLVADNPDNKLAMDQVQQDDVQEGTLEKTSLGSATPEYKHECGLPEEAVLHSMQNERCSLSAEQSPFGLQSLFSQESIEESMEYGARVNAESGVDESTDCHVKCRVEKIPVLGPVSDHDTPVVSKNGDCMYTSQQDNEKEGSPKSSHEEQVASGQLGFLEAANCMKEETNSEKVACGDEENRKPVHSTDINSSCEKSDANGLADRASGISDALLTSSLIAPANDNDEVHLSSSQSQLESTAFLDEPIGCSNSEELHQGLKEQCNERKEDQVASGAHTSDMIEAATAEDLESGVTPLPDEERSNLRYEHLNSKLEGTEVVESGVSCDKDISNTLEFGSGSAMNSVGKRTPSDSTLPKDSSMDHYQQQEPSKDFSVEKSPEESAMCCENSVSRADNVPGTIEKPSFTTLDCKHEGAMFEEALHSLRNDAGRCSSNLKQSPIGLQFLFSQENMEGSGTHDALAFPIAENGVDESNVCHFECPVEKNVSSEPVSYQGSDEDLSRVKENGGCMFSSQQDNVEGLSKSNHGKGWVASAQLDSSEDVNHMEREIIPEVVCKDEPAEHASGVSGTQYCSSQSTPICDDVHLSSNSLQLESLDAFDDLIAFANTEVLHQDHKDECNEHDEDQVIPGILASGMSESAPIEGSESGMTLLPASETSALPDEQLDRKLEGNEVVEHSLSCNKDTTSISDTGSVENNNLSSLPKDSYMDSCHEQQIPNDLSAPKSLEESAVCQDDSVHMDCFHEQELPSDLAAPKSPKESAICRDDGVSESVGICQTSRRRIDEISTELLSFKISSTVEGSYIAMNAASTKQGDNLSQSTIALLRNRENTPAVKTDLPVKLNHDRTVAKNSSRRALQTISGRPRDR